MPLSVVAQSTLPHAAGLCADGQALGEGAGRQALDEAMRGLSAADAVAGAGRAAALCQALTECARALAGLHAYAPAESYLAQALGWAARMGGHDLAADLHCAWAEVAGNATDLAEAQGERSLSRSARKRAREHAAEAARLAALTSDPQWELRVLMRASDVLDRCGNHDDAMLLQQRALTLMGLGQPSLLPDGPLAATLWADMGPLTAPGLLM